MKTKKSEENDASAGTAENTGHTIRPGYLSKLTLLHREHSLPIRILNACQIRRKHADPATVAKYAELLQESEPPGIIVIVDRGRSSPGLGKSIAVPERGGKSR